MTNEMSEGKDYILQIKIRNGPLIRAIRAAGFRSAKAFSDSCGCSYPRLCEYLKMSRSPMLRNGDWSPNILKIARALHSHPEALFPHQHIDRAIENSTAEVEISAAEIQALIGGEQSSPLEAIERDEAHTKLVELMHTLTEREERILRLRYGIGCEPTTLDDVAILNGVTIERIRQIEKKALRKLKNPKRSSQLIKCGGYDWMENYRGGSRRGRVLTKLMTWQNENDEIEKDDENFEEECHERT